MSTENPFDAITDGPSGGGGTATPPDSNEKMMATFSHLGVVVGLIIPFGSILTPLIIWLTQKEKSQFVTEHAKEALNFQITVFIGIIISLILMLIFIGFILIFAVLIINLILSIMAAVKANEGVDYKYPMNIRFIK